MRCTASVLLNIIKKTSLPLTAHNLYLHVGIYAVVFCWQWLITTVRSLIHLVQQWVCYWKVSTDPMKCIVCQGDNNKKTDTSNIKWPIEYETCFIYQKKHCKQTIGKMDNEGQQYVYHNNNDLYMWCSHKKKIQAFELELGACVKTFDLYQT